MFQLGQERMGEMFALATAISWAFAVILFKGLTDKMSAHILNLCKNIFALSLLIITLLFLPLFGHKLNLSSLSVWDCSVLFLSGLVGIGLADTFFFKSLNKVGASWIALVECLYSPLVILCAFLLLGEQLSPKMLLGGSLIILSLILPLSQQKYMSLSKEQLQSGLMYGFSAMALMAMAITFAKPVLNEQSVIVASSIRILGGLAYLLGQSYITHKNTLLSTVTQAFGQNWKTLLPAAFLGSYLAYMFWIAGFKYISASKASLLNQTSTVFTIVFAFIILKEPVHLIKIISILIALAGSLIILL